LFHVLIGAGLVAAGGSALNHGYERHRDAKMRRTANRPGPAGRLSVAEIYAFGTAMAAAGLAYLLYSMPHATAAMAAGLTFVLYVFVYTPLKPVTAWNTIVGAVPGALPPVIGWCAARPDFSNETAELFGILFFWQLPHFYSIAWLHRADYQRGGMVMLPLVDPTAGLLTGLTAVATCVGLLVVSVLPTVTGTAGLVYLAGALPISLWFLARTIRFAQNRNDTTARSVLRGSIVHLTAVMALFVVDGVVPRFQG
jgi:protoheme IX farnesyltransferase